MRKDRQYKEEETAPVPVYDASLSLPVIAIVGRPNVGKSSLFNAILRRRQAIVHFDSGVTRDRITSSGVHDGRRFNLIDTGGLGMFTGEKRGVGFWDQAIADQVEAAIESAATILFVVDVTCGLTPLDKEIAARLRSSGKKVVLAVNKADNSATESDALEFHQLGLGKVHTVSSLHRLGIDSLMDDVLDGIPKNTVADGSENEPRPLRIAVLGRPNVGKSSIVNRILGEDRVIVSDVPGTTRDAVDIQFTLRCGDEEVAAVLVDTAGLRKKSKIDEAVERYSMMRAEEALEKCDIVLFVIEATTRMSTSQDKTISRMIIDSGKGCIIVANKSDACTDVKRKELITDLQDSLPMMKYAPLVLVSAKKGTNFEELFEAIAELRAQMSIKVSTSVLNKVITDAQKKNLPPVLGRPFRIYYGTMIGNCPPRFSLFVNDPKLCAENYRTYLENYFRKAFTFTGFPIRLVMKPRRREELSDILQRKEQFKRAKRQENREKNFKPSRKEEEEFPEDN